VLLFAFVWPSVFAALSVSCINGDWLMGNTGSTSETVTWEVIQCDPELTRSGRWRFASDTGARLRIVFVRTARVWVEFFNELRVVNRDYYSYFDIDVAEYLPLVFTLLAAVLIDFIQYLIVESAALQWRRLAEHGR
jgi:hypothetical protein